MVFNYFFVTYRHLDLKILRQCLFYLALQNYPEVFYYTTKVKFPWNG